MQYNQVLNHDILNKVLPIPVVFNETTETWDFNVEYIGLVIKINPDKTGTIAEDGDTIQPLEAEDYEDIPVTYTPETTGENQGEIELSGETLSLNGISELSGFKFSLTYNVTKGGDIQGEKEQNVFEGLTGNTVTALADENYKFVTWNDGNTNPVREDVVTKDSTFTAIFVRTDKDNKLLYQYQE